MAAAASSSTAPDTTSISSAAGCRQEARAPQTTSKPGDVRGLTAQSQRSRASASRPSPPGPPRAPALLRIRRPQHQDREPASVTLDPRRRLPRAPAPTIRFSAAGRAARGRRPCSSRIPDPGVRIGRQQNRSSAGGGARVRRPGAPSNRPHRTHPGGRPASIQRITGSHSKDSVPSVSASASPPTTGSSAARPAGPLRSRRGSHRGRAPKLRASGRRRGSGWRRRRLTSTATRGAIRSEGEPEGAAFYFDRPTDPRARGRTGSRALRGGRVGGRGREEDVRGRHGGLRRVPRDQLRSVTLYEIPYSCSITSSSGSFA